MEKIRFSALALIIISLAVAMVSTSCTTKQKSNRPSQSAFYQGGEQGLPKECEGRQIERQYIMNNVAVTCSCAAGQRKHTWYNIVMRGTDPATHCYNPAIVFGEQYMLETTSVAPVASASQTAALPPMPTVVAITSTVSAVSSSTATIVPTPTAVVSAVPVASASPAPGKLNIRHEKYHCAQGLARRDFYLVVKPGHEQSVHQECVGENIICLSGEAEQRDVSRPPCGCADNKAPVKINVEQNIWGCKS